MTTVCAQYYEEYTSHPTRLQTNKQTNKHSVPLTERKRS